MLLLAAYLGLMLAAPVNTDAATASYALQTSWTAPDAAYIVSDGSSIWTLNASGTRVTHYGGTGQPLGAWETNAPSGTFALGRGIGVDANGLVYVLTSTQESGGLIQKFNSDGTLVNSSPPNIPYNLGFAVGADGMIYGGDDSDDATELVALSNDGAQFMRILPCCHAPLFARGASVNLIPPGLSCGGPTNTQSGCYNVVAAAATPSMLFVSAYWCNGSAECLFETRVYGPGTQLIGTISSSAREGMTAAGGIAIGSDGVFILTGAGTIEKWTPTGPTRIPNATWGTVKSHWR